MRSAVVATAKGRVAKPPFPTTQSSYFNHKEAARLFYLAAVTTAPHAIENQLKMK